MYDPIYYFSAKHCGWSEKDQSISKKVLGGKGAGLVAMAQAGFNVPPGFTITTAICNELSKLQGEEADGYFDGLMQLVLQNDDQLSDHFGYAPLVAVRSGAPVSMPGMMDTILNVGLTEGNLPQWEKRIGTNPAMDSYRRLIQMLGQTAYGVKMEVFNDVLEGIKADREIGSDADMTVDALQEVIDRYLAEFEAHVGKPFPQTREEQLAAAVGAVFKSWMNPRAIEYRKLNKIDPNMGTACNVQAMVFGNMGDASGTGVLFTRDPSTGEPGIMGEYLPNAQGEDVVAGIRTPLNVNSMGLVEPEKTLWNSIRAQLVKVSNQLETMYVDMVDLEFTVQQGELFILQSRVGKRSAQAAFRIAVDQVELGEIDVGTALKRLTAEQYKIVSRPTIDPSFKGVHDHKGLAGCPGVVSGKPVFSAQDAVNCTEPCILVTHETNPNDIAGMAAAVGILTQTGGATSHAAVVARAMDKACVTGCTDLPLSDLKAQKLKRITIDGSTGRVWIDTEVPLVDASESTYVKKVVDWSLTKKGLGVAVPAFMSGEGKQGIFAAHWWGHADLAAAVISDLVKQHTLDYVSLVAISPVDFRPAADEALEGAFGTKDDDHAYTDNLHKAVAGLASDLAGLSVVTSVQEAKKFVHPDYAVFTAIGS